MRRTSVTIKVVLGFAVAVVLLLLVDVVALRNIRDLERSAKLLLQAQLVIGELDDVLLEMQNAETGQRGYLLTGDESYLKPYHRAVQRIHEELENVRLLTSDNPLQQKYVESLDSLAAEKLVELEETIRLRQEAGFDEAVAVVATDRGKGIMDGIRAVVETMQAEEQRVLESRTEATAKGTLRTVAVIAVGSSLGLFLMGVALLLIMLDLRKRLAAEAAVQQAYDDLEVRVRERTEELNRVNVELRDQMEQREQAQDHLRDTLSKLTQSHENTRRVLDTLNLGSVMVDGESRIRFFSGVAQRVFLKDREMVEGQTWWDALPLNPDDRRRLAALCDADPKEREVFAAKVTAGDGRSYWVEIDVWNDPTSPKGRIFILHDVSEIYSAESELAEDHSFDDLVGSNEAMRRIFREIRAFAAVDATVLIEGETGTGKELVARAIHRNSPRAGKLFVPVNAAGLTESLLASQLFGHRKGAFTGAVEDREGFFEAAQGGTLFLDEIGDVPVSVQTSLLRGLQEREIVRVGETRPRKVDVRVLAATQHDLAALVEAGKFRMDLFYRIRVGRIALPPLRRRRDDIPLLAQTFLSQLRGAGGKNVAFISSEAMLHLLEYPWPGNVRELRGVIEFAVIRAAGSVVLSSDLPPEVRHFREPWGESYRGEANPTEDESGKIRAALEAAGGNRTQAAQILGISRSTLYRKIAALGLQLPD